MHVSHKGGVSVISKLILRLNDSVIKQARKTAQNKGVSLSRMVEDYFKSIAAQKTRDVWESPVLYEVAGVLTGKQNAAGLRGRYRNHVTEKYRQKATQ